MLHNATAYPASSAPANIDVREWAGRSARAIEANAADEIWILALDPLHRREHNANVREVDAAVAVEIVHPAVAVVVDNHVCCITELMATVARTSAFIAQPH